MMTIQNYHSLEVKMITPMVSQKMYPFEDGELINNEYVVLREESHPYALPNSLNRISNKTFSIEKGKWLKLSL